MDASRPTLVDLNDRDYVLKKLLLKKAFGREMHDFMQDPQCRYDASKCPTLYRAFERVSASPLFPQDQLGVLDQFMDLLPEVQGLVLAATGRDFGREVTNLIATSWSANMKVKTNADRETAQEVLPEPNVATQPTLDEEDRADVMYFFSAWETPEMPGTPLEENSEDEDEAALCEALAMRRLRRRNFMLELVNLVNRVSEGGIPSFIEDLEKARSFADLPHVSRNCLRRFFSLLRLLVLHGLKQKHVRAKAKKMLRQVPGTALKILFKFSNPITLAHMGASLAVRVRLPFGNNLLQGFLRTSTDVEKTETKIESTRKSIPPIHLKLLQRHAQVVLEQPKKCRIVDVALCIGEPLSEEKQARYEKIVQLEMRRLEKQCLVDYGASTQARFIMIEFFPILGKPFLPLFQGMGKDSRFMSEIMSSLENLISSIEAKDMDRVIADIHLMELLAFNLAQTFIRHNRALFEVLFTWLLQIHTSRPDVIDLNELFGDSLDAAFREAEQMSSHWQRGGRTSFVATPVLDSGVEAFQKALRESVHKN